MKLEILFILGTLLIIFGIALIKGIMKHYRRFADISEPIHMQGIYAAVAFIIIGVIGVIPFAYTYLVHLIN